jgi:hypothetical protein
MSVRPYMSTLTLTYGSIELQHKLGDFLSSFGFLSTASVLKTGRQKI